MLFPVTIILIITQRLSELLLAKRNENHSFARGGYEVDHKGYIPVVIMHILFFISLTAEYYYLSISLNRFWVLLVFIFISAQFLRYWAIFSLGYQWNTRIIIVPGAKLVKIGPYKYFKHPNYTAVIIELAVLPLIFNCYITAIVFSLLNAVLLKRRIKIENEAILKLI